MNERERDAKLLMFIISADLEINFLKSEIFPVLNDVTSCFCTEE